MENQEKRNLGEIAPFDDVIDNRISAQHTIHVLKSCVSQIAHVNAYTERLDLERTCGELVESLKDAMDEMYDAFLRDRKERADELNEMKDMFLFIKDAVRHGHFDELFVNAAELFGEDLSVVDT